MIRFVFLCTTLLSIFVYLLEDASSINSLKFSDTVSSSNDDPEEYLIITREMFKDDLTPLIDAKKLKGYSVLTITLSEIDSRYIGKDIQEKIRNCVKDRHENQNAQWILLVGSPDADDNPGNAKFVLPTLIDKTWEIPIRYVYCPVDSYTYVPSEMYYSCLDGNWDADGDEIYGEKVSDCQIGIDEVDWLPDVSLGRIPARTKDQVQNYISKLMATDYSSLDEKQMKALQIHCKLNNGITDWAIDGSIFADAPGYELPTNSNIYRELNTGNFQIVTITGHGTEQSWYLRDGSNWSGENLTADKIDIEQGNVTRSVLINKLNFFAQSFTAISETLNRVDLDIEDINSSSADLVVSIRASLNGQDLTYSILSPNAAHLGFNHMNFNTISTIPGKIYYLIVTSPNSILDSYWVIGRGNDDYDKGTAYEGSIRDGFSNWKEVPMDLCFRIVKESGTVKTFLAYASACLTSYVDKSNIESTIAEELLFKKNSGAVGYIGAWRLSTPIGQNDLWLEFWRSFYDESFTRIGQTISQAWRNFYFSYAYWLHNWYDYWHFTQLIYSLFGDPDLQIGKISPNGPKILSIPKMLAPSKTSFNPTGNIYHYDNDNFAKAIGNGNVMWKKISGPEYFKIAQNGLISWHPHVGTELGNNGRPEIVIRASDVNGSTDQHWYTQCYDIYGSRECEIVSKPFSYAIAGYPYKYDANNRPEVIGLNSARWKVIKAPFGFTMDALTGEISWLPKEKGRFEIIIQVTSPEVKYALDFQHFEVVVDSEIPVPNANFIVDSSFVSKGQVIEFTDLSEGNITNWNWEFGDGHISTEFRPLHSYKNNGIYTVKLSISGPNGSGTIIKKHCITVGSWNLVIDSTKAFHAIGDEVPVTLFSDTSTISMNYENNTALSLKFKEGKITGKRLYLTVFGTFLSDTIFTGQAFEKSVCYFGIRSEEIINCSALLSISYNDSVLNSLKILENNLKIVFWDENDCKWKILPTIIDTVKNAASTKDVISHFSIWALTDKNDPLIASVEIPVSINSDTSTVSMTFENKDTIVLKFKSGKVSGKKLFIAAFGTKLPDTLQIPRFEKTTLYYLIRSKEIIDFAASFAICYNDSNLRQLYISERDLEIAFFDENDFKWKALPTIVDTVTNVASTKDVISHFSIWALTDKNDPIIASVDQNLEKSNLIDYRLSQNYPNPFNLSTNIEYSIKNRSYVKIEIYSILGNVVKTLFYGNQNSGTYKIQWDGKNDSGILMPSGIYFYRLRAGNFVETKKMILLK